MSTIRGDDGDEFREVVRRFKLKDAHTTGGNTTAYVVVYRNGTKTDTTTEFTVSDPFSIFEGDVGAYGYARRMPDSGKWEILQMQCPA